ncbi:MAG: metalloregulator ArsR/SmtB family transcription factor [Nitrospirota bacterium]
MNGPKSIYEMQAEVCKVFSSPLRIEIIDALEEGEKSVGELISLLGSPASNISQHLSLMRAKGILSCRREGAVVYYHIAHYKITEACTIMKEVLLDLLTERGDMARLVRGAE